MDPRRLCHTQHTPAAPPPDPPGVAAADPKRPHLDVQGTASCSALRRCCKRHVSPDLNLAETRELTRTPRPRAGACFSWASSRSSAGLGPCPVRLYSTRICQRRMDRKRAGGAPLAAFCPHATVMMVSSSSGVSAQCVTPPQRARLTLHPLDTP